MGLWIYPSRSGEHAFRTETSLVNYPSKDRPPLLGFTRVEVCRWQPFGLPLSDHGSTPLVEAHRLHEMGVFDSLTLLKLWCESTPKTIFPHRKIAFFDEGYEASFLVLAGNPIEDFQQVKHITFRFKQGTVITPRMVPHEH